MSNTYPDPEVEEGFRLIYGNNSNYPVSNAYSNPEYYRQYKRDYENKQKELSGQSYDMTEPKKTSKSNQSYAETNDANSLSTPIPKSYWTTPSSEFNVANYVNPLTCALHGGLQGYTLNCSDEIMGGMGASWGVGKALATGEGVMETAADYYQKVRDQARLHLDLCHQEYPYLTGASEITGAVFSPLKLAGLGRYSIPAIGAVAGFGAGEGDALNQLTSVGVGIAGAKLGDVGSRKTLKIANPYIKPMAQYTGRNLKPFLGKNYSRRFAKGMTQFAKNPYTKSFYGNTLDYMLNQQMRQREQEI